jgi:hypothetical protein
VQELEKGQGVADLVLLEMADEVPPCAGGRQWDLRSRLLHAALAKQELPGFHGLSHRFRRVGFRNRDELDFIDRSAGPRGGGSDLVVDLLQTFGEIGH